MAVAVKNASETTEQSLFDRLAMRSLLGVLYVLVSVGLVLYGLPFFWRSVLTPALSQVGVFVDVALMLVVLVAAVIGAIWWGLRLLGPSPTPGLRGSIFLGLVALALVAVLTWVIGAILDAWLGASGIDLVGQVVVAAIGLALLGLVATWYLKPGREDFFIRFEEQGWLSTTQYKKSQGLKVRRGTILGILLLAGAGIYTMLSHQLLPQGPWSVSIPFTGMAEVKTPGDSSIFQERARVELPFWTSRYEWELEKIHVQDLVRIRSVGDSDFEEGQVVEKKTFDAQRKELEKKGERPPTSGPAQEPTGSTVYAWHLWILPDMKYTVPLILIVAVLWLAFRIVNFPPFADFLIATEAELNKVSWSTRKRLVQDTIVVLVTVLLFTLFLLVVDAAWSFVLSYVNVMPKPTAAKTSDVDQPW